MDEKENIVNESELASREERGQVISLFQKLLNMLLRELPGIQKDLNIKNGYNIIHIERWLRDSSKQVFRNYLDSTHWNMENLLKDEFNEESTFRCIRITFMSGDSIIFVNNPKITIDAKTGKAEESSPLGILCFDSYRKRLNPKKEKDFDQIFMELNQFEKWHFKSDSYTDKLWKILDTTKNNIIGTTYTDRLILALNLKYERI